MLLNDSDDCPQLSSAYPDHSAVGARALQPGLINRVVFELRTEPTARETIAQVGVACVAGGALQGGRLDRSTPLLGAVLCTGAGDVLSTAGPLEALAPGAQGPGLAQRLDDWCGGGPSWLLGGRRVARVLLEVDLRLGQLAVSVGDWSEEPAVVRAPGLLEGAAGEARAWLPMVSLTAVGQEARLLDLSVRTEI